MRKQLFTKFFAVLLISITFSMLIMTGNVQAMTQEQTNQDLNEILETEEKIMMYDAKTNETTEVDVEELKQVLSSQTRVRGGSYDSIAPYDPYANSNIVNNAITPLSANSAERVTNTYNFPNRVTSRIKAQTTKNNVTYNVYGTCAIVGPNAGLTAAHCVFDKDNGNAAYRNWTIYPGCNGLDSNGNPIYYGTACGWDRVYYSNKWMETHSDQYDWAICVLQSDVGNQLGWFGVQSYGSNSELNNVGVKVYSYPGDTNYGFYSDARYQYTTGEKITSVGDRYFRYSGWTFGGFSGGPIARTSDNYIVGVHYGLVWNTPTGVRITQEMIDIIRSLN